jgi:hypothetical protein
MKGASVMQQSRKINWIARFFLMFLALALILALWPVSKIQTAGVPMDANVVLAETQPQSPGAGILKAADKDGFPVPDNYTSYVGGKTAYMQSVDATTPADLKAVLAFYGRELKTRHWSESPGTAVNAGAKSLLVFENKKKEHLALKLTQNAKGGTDIRIIVKSKTAAAKDGILPLPGKARIYLGNMADKPAVFKILQKKFVLKMQSTSDQSMKDAPFVEVKPGVIPYTLTVDGQKPVSDKFEVGPDETWGLIAGPGGALPMQLY